MIRPILSRGIRRSSWLGLVGCLACVCAACVEPPKPAPRAPEPEPVEPIEVDPVAIWSNALLVDGSERSHEEARAALRSIAETQAHEAAPVIAETLERVLAQPDLDSLVGREGELRSELCKTLGTLRSEQGLRALVAVLRQPEGQQPKGVIKAAIRALGQIGDPSVTSDLVTVQFHIVDAPSTVSVPELAITAIAGIGDPAVPALLDMLEQREHPIYDLALTKGVDAEIVELTIIRILGEVGSQRSTAALLNHFRQCSGAAPADQFEIVAESTQRAFVAHALGFIADPSAVDVLCGCRDASHDPIDLYEITAALGRIGGERAFACLGDITSKGSYDPDLIASPGYEHEIRWESFRWLILAASPEQAAAIRRLERSSTAAVREKIAEAGWLEGVAVLEQCGDDRACHRAVVSDRSRHWFAREVAAFRLARTSQAPDLGTAADLARAFEIPNPEARVNVAWLAGKVAAGERCPECAEALEAVMKSEELTKDASMQPAWLTARRAIAKLTAGPPSSGSKP